MKLSNDAQYMAFEISDNIDSAWKSGQLTGN